MTQRVNGGATDQEQIRDCLTRYCRAIDRRDKEMLLSVYWPGAIDDHVVFAGPAEEFAEWVYPLLETMEVTQHNLGHSYFEMHGDVAMVETCVTAYHRVPMEKDTRDIMLGARYIDRMEKRGGEWRIAHRILIQDWMQDMGQSIDWSKGSLGMTALHDNGFGRGRDDASVAFFKSLGKSK